MATPSLSGHRSPRDGLDSRLFRLMDTHIQLGEELWILGPRVGISETQLREALRRVSRVAGARDEGELEAVFLGTLGKHVRVERKSGAELVYIIEDAS